VNTSGYPKIEVGKTYLAISGAVITILYNENDRFYEKNRVSYDHNGKLLQYPTIHDLLKEVE
jgi:hypothetical protein